MFFKGHGLAVISFLSLMLILGLTQSFAQDFLIHNYDENNLPSLNVTGVCQDSTGVMWFSTRAGVVRYDGSTWEVIDPSLNKISNSYRHILIDKKGRTWVLGLGSPFQLNVLDGGQWVDHRVPETREWGWDVLSFDLCEQPDGSVFLAATSDQTFFFWDGKTWQHFGITETLGQIRALSFVGEKLYLASSLGLLEFDPADKSIDLIQLNESNDLKKWNPGPIQSLTPMSDPQQGLWLVGTDWVGQLQNGRFQRLGSDLALDFSKLETGTVALSGPSGGLFFGGTEEFYHFHPQRGLRTLSKANGLVSNGITALFLDREDNIWVTNPRGISKLISMRLETFDSRSGLADDEVSAIIEQPDGGMVLGHDGSLTFLGPGLDPEMIPLSVERDLPGTGRVMDLDYDPQGQLWVAFDQWGLAQVQDGHRLTWLGVEDGLPEYIYAIHFDPQGVLWVGGSEGLYRRTDGGFEKIHLMDLDSNRLGFIRRINPGLDGSLLISTGMYGAFQVKNDEARAMAKPETSISGSCYQIYDRGDGEYWVATNSGLCRINRGVLELTTNPGPVIHRPVYSIMKDSKGHFWFGTDDGVRIWDGTRLTSLNIQDGLLGREFNRDALLLASDGRIWMGTDRGLTIYDHLFDQPRAAKPIATIGNFIADGVQIDFTNERDISPDHYELTIPFKAVSFLNESETQFKTWLEGLEPHWQPYQSYPTGRIRYTNLPPGKFQFHLQARNVAGVESDIIKSEVFRVEKPLTQLWWFIGLEILGTLALLSGIIYLVLGRRYRVRLEGEFRQRTLELRSTENAVRKESRRLFAILTSISDGVLAVDQDLKVVLSNPKALAILGIRLDDAVGRDLGDVLDVDPPLMTEGQGLHENLEQRDDLTIPVHQLKNPNGELRSLEISLASLSLGDEEATGWVVAFRDITQRQHMEKEMVRNQQLDSLGVLAGGIAHDFNNLLTIMLGNLSLIERATTYNEDEQSRLESMKMATLRARGLAEQLLTFAKGGAPELRPVNLGELVKQCMDFALSGSNVLGRMDIPEDLWLVEGDPGQLGQVVNNLVINAIQAMSSGGFLDLELSNCSSMPGKADVTPCVCLEIRDQGKGINSENLGRIFNPYFTTKGTGSGLGLTIVHSIVTGHGGQISAESNPGKGTCFKIFLPAVSKTSATHRGPVMPSLSTGLRVLVLDDEKEVLLLVEQMLTRLGLHCEGVTSGDAAVEAFALAMGRNRPFSVFIADLTIPGGVGGVEAFRKIRLLDDSVRGIVISGYSNDAVMANFQDYGFGAAVRKPFGREQLAEGLAKVLNENEIRKN